MEPSFYIALSSFYRKAEDIAEVDDEVKEELRGRFHVINKSLEAMGWGMDKVADPEFD